MVLFTLFGFFALNNYRSRKKHAKDAEWGGGALLQYGKKNNKKQAVRLQANRKSRTGQKLILI